MTEKKKKDGKRFSFFQRFKRDQAIGSQRETLEQLFYDMYQNRRQIYFMNFFRGLFFGFGSVIGATVLLALLVWLLSQLGALVPFLSDFIQQILDALSNKAR